MAVRRCLPRIVLHAANFKANTHINKKLPESRESQKSRKNTPTHSITGSEGEIAALEARKPAPLGEKERRHSKAVVPLT
jgi:hypothetical protein